jgi:hypothetical protein
MLKVVEFPNRPACQNIPEALRELAKSIEEGSYADAHNLVWAIDCGDGRVEIGLLGQTPSPATTAYFLLGLAKRRLEDI